MFCLRAADPEEVARTAAARIDETAVQAALGCPTTRNFGVERAEHTA